MSEERPWFVEWHGKWVEIHFCESLYATTMQLQDPPGDPKGRRHQETFDRLDKLRPDADGWRRVFKVRARELDVNRLCIFIMWLAIMEDQGGFGPDYKALADALQAGPNAIDLLANLA